MKKVLHNFTTGCYMAVGGGIVAETLMARDYKDPQCVVIEDDDSVGRNRDVFDTDCK